MNSRATSAKSPGGDSPPGPASGSPAARGGEPAQAGLVQFAARGFNRRGRHACPLLSPYYAKLSRAKLRLSRFHARTPARWRCIAGCAPRTAGGKDAPHACIDAFTVPAHGVRPHYASVPRVRRCSGDSAHAEKVPPSQFHLDCIVAKVVLNQVQPTSGHGSMKGPARRPRKRLRCAQPASWTR
jgi:hypothetical protein